MVMDDYQEIRTRIISAVERAGVAIDHDTEDVDLRDYIPDSVATIAALVEIEDEFNISLPDDFLLGTVLESLSGLTSAIAEVVKEGA